MTRSVTTATLARVDYQATCGARLRKVIRLLDMRYVEAAEAMGVSKHVLNHWMKGTGPIDTYALMRLCKARGINFDYIFLGNWEAMPHQVAKVLDAELAGALPPVPAGGKARDRTDAETHGGAGQSMVRAA